MADVALLNFIVITVLSRLLLRFQVSKVWYLRYKVNSITSSRGRRQPLGYQSIITAKFP
jgi:hypothetical protein